MLRNIFRKAATLAPLMALLLAVSAQPLHADCQKKIHKAERNLEKAIQKHGLHSDQAAQRRDQLERARARCHN